MAREAALVIAGERMLIGRRESLMAVPARSRLAPDRRDGRTLCERIERLLLQLDGHAALSRSRLHAARQSGVRLVMSLAVIPFFLHRLPAITIRWWVQLIGHIPVVALPIVASIGRGDSRPTTIAGHCDPDRARTAFASGSCHRL